MTAKPYLIWSNEHEAWWRPNSAGYCLDVTQAGRYSEEEADEICRGAWPDRKGRPDEEKRLASEVLKHLPECVELAALREDRAILDFIDREHWMDGGEMIGGERHTEIRILVPGRAGDYPNGIRDAVKARMNAVAKSPAK